LTSLDSFIEILNKKDPLPPIEFNNTLCIKVPVMDKWFSKEEYGKLVKDKKKEMKTNNLKFHFDIGYNDVETSAVLQLIDDNKLFKGKRREYILDQSALQVGISNAVEGKKNCTYIVFLNK